MKYLIDVRTKEEFEAGHAHGALNIPYDEIDTIENIITSILKEDRIELYCLSGGRAEAAKNILERKGFLNVVNLGGIKN